MRRKGKKLSKTALQRYQMADSYSLDLVDCGKKNQVRGPDSVHSASLWSRGDSVGRFVVGSTGLARDAAPLVVWFEHGNWPGLARRSLIS